MVVFSRKFKLNGLVIPKLSGQHIALVDQVKYLGVILDKKLTWAPHLDAKITKAINAFWLCRRFIGQTWGLSPKTIFFLYTTFIRPMFAYASVVWWPRVKIKDSIAKLNHLQRMACLAITGAMSTTPTLAMEAILSIPPLDTFILGTASSAAYRLNCCDAWNVRGKVLGHTQIWDFVKSQIPFIDMFSDVAKSEYDFDLPYSFMYPSREWWSMEASESLVKDSVTFFTDGSLTDTGSGYGVYSPSLKVAVSESLGKFSTVFQAESAALFHCALEAYKFNLRNKSILICTDSLAALHALASPKINSKLIRDCKAAFVKLSHSNRVTLCWVPGHSGIGGNEIADELARNGAGLSFVGPDPAVGLSINTGKSLIKQWMHEQLVGRWSVATSCRQTKLYLPKPNRVLARYALSLKKRDLRILIQILSGHGQFNVHLNRMDPLKDPLCEHCLEDEDNAEHFVCECPAFSSIRKIFLSSELIPTVRLRNISWARILNFCKASERFKETL